MDKAGGFIGYLFVKNEAGTYCNLSELLVENGFATVHFNAERSRYYNSLLSAEKRAKDAQLGLWKNYVDNDADQQKHSHETDNTERKIDYKKVVVTEVLPGFRFAVQTFDDGKIFIKKCC